MPETLESLRAEIVRSRPKTNNLGFPPDLRERVAAWVRSERSKEVSTSALARQLGLSRHSVQAWLAESPKTGQTKSACSPARTFLPAQVVPEPRHGPLTEVVLRSPRGYCVEGLDLGALSELLERIG